MILLKNDVDIYNVKFKNIEDKISDITNVDSNTTFKAKTNEIKNKIQKILLQYENK